MDAQRPIKEQFTPARRHTSAAYIYDILVNVCGAPENERQQFTFYLLEQVHSWEWRFRGCLGFGGKFYDDGYEWRVGCYPEDETPERRDIIMEARKQLAELRAERVE